MILLVHKQFGWGGCATIMLYLSSVMVTSETKLDSNLDKHLAVVDNVLTGGIGSSCDDVQLPTAPNTDTKSNSNFSDSIIGCMNEHVGPLCKKSGSFQFPDDAIQHFQDIFSITTLWRDCSVHFYHGYHGPWIEQYWMEVFKTHRHRIESNDLAWFRKTFGGAIPIFAQWTDCSNHGIGLGSRHCDHNDQQRQSCKVIDALRKILRPNVAYVTVAQHDCGIIGSWCNWNGFHVPISPILKHTTHNIFVFSAGGYGHSPIPLIMGHRQTESVHQPANRMYNISYVGTVGHAPRLFRENLGKWLGKFAKRNNETIFYGRSDKWVSVMKNSKLQLSPRGFGRSAFHIYEALQMGLVPVYVYDDEEWIPYIGSPNDVILRINASTKLSTNGGLTKLLDFDDDQISAREQKIKTLIATHFTYEGTMMQIMGFLQAGEAGSDLRCRSLPKTTN